MPFSVFSLQALAIAAAFFAAGILDSICGGGGLITVPVMLLTGMPAHLTTGTNQCSTTLGNIVSCVKYGRSGIIRYRAAIPAVPLAIIGGYLGSRLNLIVDEKALEIVMIVLVPCLAVLLILKRNFGGESRFEALPRWKQNLFSALIGLIVGTYQGFYGPGSGTLFLLAFALIDRLDLLGATGTTRFVGACSSLASTITFAASGQVYWQLALVCMAVNTAGSYLGSCMAIKNGAKLIRPLMIFVMLLLVAYILRQII